MDAIFWSLCLSVVSKVFAPSFNRNEKRCPENVKRLKGKKDDRLLESALGREIKQVGVMCSVQEESRPPGYVTLSTLVWHMNPNLLLSKLETSSRVGH